MTEPADDFVEPLIELPDAIIAGAVRKQLSSLGRLGEAVAWYASTSGGTAIPQRTRLLIVTGDHAAGAAVTSAKEDPPRVTTSAAEWLTSEQIRPETGTIAAFKQGRQLASREADSGTNLLLVADSGRGATTVAAVLVGLLCGTDVATVTGRGAGLDDRQWMGKAAVVRDLMRSARPHLGEPLALLSAVGSDSAAMLSGLLLESAARRTPVLLDGYLGAAAGLVAQRLAYRAPRWWYAAGLSAEPGHRIALDRLDIKPMLDLGIGRSAGFTASLAAAMLREALADASS